MQADEPGTNEPARHDGSNPSTVSEVLLALLVVTGYASPFLLGCVLAFSAVASLGALLPVAAVGGFAVWLVLVIRARRRIRDRGPRGYRLAGDLLVLVILPCWGLVYAYGVGHDTCIHSACDEVVYRPLALPEVYGLLSLHAVTVLAYAVSRRRPEALRPATELLVLGTLVAGAFAHALLVVHFGKWILLGVVFPPLFFPCAAPLFTCVLYVSELLARLRRRGREARLARAGLDCPQPPYRQHPEPAVPTAPLEVHRAKLAGSLGVGAALLGLHAVVHAFWLGRAAGALDVFTRTCGYTFSQVPIELVPAECHYLCTVAARGHRWLVRPLRAGRRRGVIIVVNRQLAVANAFEDMLHERWPRFGRWARGVYDRLGLPVSRYIRSRWLADVVYLAMKPLEISFSIALLLLDRDSPEARIDRMYR